MRQCSGVTAIRFGIAWNCHEFALRDQYLFTSIEPDAQVYDFELIPRIDFSLEPHLTQHRMLIRLARPRQTCHGHRYPPRETLNQAFVTSWKDLNRRLSNCHPGIEWPGSNQVRSSRGLRVHRVRHESLLGAVSLDCYSSGLLLLTVFAHWFVSLDNTSSSLSASKVSRVSTAE